MEELFRLPATPRATRWVDWDREKGKFYLVINPYEGGQIKWEQILKETAIALCLEFITEMESESLHRCKVAGLLPGDSLTELGDLFILLRKRRGWTQKELGEKLGIPMQNVQRYEQDRYQSATLRRLQQVEKVLLN